MERQPVIETLPHQFLDARDMVGREIGTQLDHDAPIGQIEVKRVFGIENGFDVGGGRRTWEKLRA